MSPNEVAPIGTQLSQLAAGKARRTAVRDAVIARRQALADR